jgi:Tfp pilus assembly protein PilZ
MNAMWQAPNTRRGKRRGRDKYRRPLHLKRVSAELKSVEVPGVPPILAETRIVLNDLSPFGVGLFSERQFNVGQEVALTLEQPRRIYVRGRVVWCEDQSPYSHVMSAKPFGYRIGIQFSFNTEQEQEALRTFCDQIAREHLHAQLPYAA